MELSNSSTQNSSDSSTLFLLIPALSTGLVGVVAHILVVLFTINTKHDAVRIITCGSAAEAVLAFHAGPWLGSAYAMQQPLGTNGAGIIPFTCFSVSANCNLLLAFNRCIAIHKPMEYKQMFTKQRTLLYIGAIWVASAALCIIFSIPGCRYVADVPKFHTIYEDTTCGYVMKIIGHVFGLVVLMALLLNCVSVSKLRKTRMTMKKALKKEEFEKRSKNELLLFLQSCVVSATTCLVLVFVDHLPLLLQNRWSLYFVQDFVPQILLSVDGIVILSLTPTAHTAFSKVLHKGKCFSKSDATKNAKCSHKGLQRVATTDSSKAPTTSVKVSATSVPGTMS